MRIAQVAPLWESVSAAGRGDTERMVSYLTEELVRLGHEVTLFASGDSQTSARLESSCLKALRLAPEIVCREAPLYLLLERAFGTYADQFDIIHSHIDLIGFPLARRCPTPVATTLHGRLDWQELIPPFREYSELPLISISHTQRRPLPWANWLSTVHYGLPQDLFAFHPDPGKYLAFAGRISAEKGVEDAIEVAKRVDMPLRIAGTVDSAEYEYLSYIKPLLNHPLVEYLGEINGNEKHQFLGEAYALICASDGSEPLDLALIEALACGTPVLAYTRGPHAEIIEHGYTGLMGKTRDGMSALVASISQLDRRICRRQFEERFTAEKMTRDYLSLYTTLTGSRAQGLEMSELPSDGSRHAVQQPKDTSMSETAHPTAFEARTMRTVVQ